MSNYYNSETLLEQQDEIEKLKAERDALAAQVEALREHASDAAGALGFLSHHLRGRMGEAALMDMAKKADALSEALAATPQQHLAEIRAEAGRAGFVEGVRQEMLDKFGLFYIETQDRANQYADQVRQGEVK